MLHLEALNWIPTVVSLVSDNWICRMDRGENRHNLAVIQFHCYKGSVAHGQLVTFVFELLLFDLFWHPLPITAHSACCCCTIV